ncbi:hypothetical protein M758_10G020700 [Ceratodon purpureus]|nr:hypothetical protein M758_10G020700 [Ceratodon purpureus]KAG0602532.1 hypothetical protein M758_10G020700 [Ceratodon purpureus]
MGFADVFATPPLTDMETEDCSMKTTNEAQRKGKEEKEEQMHVYNAWLPQWMVKEVKEEPQRFHKLVAIMREEILRVDSPAARLATTKWIPVINAFVKAKTELDNQDLKAVINLSLELLLETSDNLFIQDQWARCISRILQKHRKLDMKIQWLPFYKLLVTTHFKRRFSYEGLGLKGDHLGSIIALVRCCRRYFPLTSAVEIWHEFRPALDDLAHNSSLEAMGFMALFMPSTIMDQVESGLNKSPSSWVNECLSLWAGLPNCRYWNFQWASLMARCIKHSKGSSFDWKPFLQPLFSNFVRSFEVPVGKAGAWCPVNRSVPRESFLAFYSKLSSPPSKEIAKSIVYLIKPGNATQGYLETLIDLLEQFYHPSNGGSWTKSLERFLRYLIAYFLARLAKEQRSLGKTHIVLGPVERIAFVKTLMRLIERGQYSKNSSLTSTVGSSACLLAFVEPSLMLPYIVSTFDTALDSITATHQLETALETLAFAARPILLASTRDSRNAGMSPETWESLSKCKRTIVDAMFSTLLGLDANDPPKTLATLELYCSVLSSVGVVGAKEDGGSGALPIDWSKWLDNFLSRLFILLVNLEPSTTTGDTEADDAFLTVCGSQYNSLVDILFCRTTPPLYEQALKTVSKFVRSTVLPGAANEIGSLCRAAVYANPEMSVEVLLVPLMHSIVSSLAESPSTGFSGDGVRTEGADFKVGLSQALESTVVYQLTAVAEGIGWGGAALLPHGELIKKVISAAFNAPSSKVNSAGGSVLTCLLGSLVWYYVTDNFPIQAATDGSGIDAWYATKGGSVPPEGTTCKWHSPSEPEIKLAEELVNLHLQGSLRDLRSICQDGPQTDISGQLKEHLRVLLLRIESTFSGLRTCLPDFPHPIEELSVPTLAGASGVTVGSSALREEAAEIIHQACEYMLENRADDTTLLKLLVDVMGSIIDYGNSENISWLANRKALDADAECVTEPQVNFINGSHSQRRRRPIWVLVERTMLHFTWRASKVGWRGHLSTAPAQVAVLCQDLLNLSLLNYAAVRSFAGSGLEMLLKRYPMLVNDCIPKLTDAIQEEAPTEDAATGACNVLVRSPLMRHLMQDWDAMASFLVAILNSDHLETVKTHDAIGRVFGWFNFCFRGVPVRAESDEEESYTSMITQLKEKVLDTGDAVGSTHWRYNLMAHGMLLFLLLPPSSSNSELDASITSKTRQSIAGVFINNLTSDLPALRPLSVMALMFLLPPVPRKAVKNGMTKGSARPQSMADGTSMENIISSVFLAQDFGNNVVKQLSHDHNYAEGHSAYQYSSMNDMGLTALMPSVKRDWPYTRTWDSNSSGEQFSLYYAKLFKSLVRESGSSVLQQLRPPLEEAARAVEERGKQCIAAEIIAGLIRSDMACVTEAWHDWLRPLLRNVLLQGTVESAVEWAACVRYALGRKGRSGQQGPVLRSCVIECLAEPLPKRAATSVMTKRLMLLQAALHELGPDQELEFQAALLTEIFDYVNHPAAQVRGAVGNLICKLGANLQRSSGEELTRIISNGHSRVQDWTSLLIEGAKSAAETIQTQGLNLDVSSADASSDTSKKALKRIETAFHFVVASVRSGNISIFMPVLLDLLCPILYMQDTWDKDVKALAKWCMQLLMWQLYPSEHLKGVVTAIMSAATHTNWHTRVAALTFLPPIVFRHTFVMEPSDLSGLWNQVRGLLLDSQIEVRELAATTLAGLMKGAGSKLGESFRKEAYDDAVSLQAATKGFKRRKLEPGSVATRHGVVLGVAACVLSVPYDMPP